MSFERNIQTALQNFVDDVVRLARIELGATRKGQRYKIVDGRWVKGKKYNKRINNSGRLSQSLDGVVKAMPNSFEADILMEEYGEWVDKGREKGAYAPSLKLQKWIATKPIRPRNKQGSFISDKLGQKQRSLTYIFNKKIKEVGIEPTYFLTEPFNLKFRDLPNEIAEAYALDVEDFLRFTIDKLNKEYKV